MQFLLRAVLSVRFLLVYSFYTHILVVVAAFFPSPKLSGYSCGFFPSPKFRWILQRAGCGECMTWSEVSA